MAYSEELAERVRFALVDHNTVEEKKMMGGLTFMVNGKMCVGVHKDEIMCRIDPDRQDEALKKPESRVMNFTGKPLIGFVLVRAKELKKEIDFNYWIDLALKYNVVAKSSKNRR